MTADVSVLRLQDAWRECERNAYHLCLAIVLLDPVMPMTGEIYTQLTDEQVRIIDQFILRFTKLQDAMGNHLFASILEYLQEPYEDRPMLDKLNRLEKLGYLISTEAWQGIRHTRNKFTHDYPDDAEKNAALINIASEAAELMCWMLASIEKKLHREQGAFKLGSPLSVSYPKRWTMHIKAGAQN